MKVKSEAQIYLEQIEKLNVMIENKKAEIERWRSVALSVTACSEGDRVQSSGSQQKMADAIERIVDLEAEIRETIDVLIYTEKGIIKTIEQLNAKDYDVLHKRYVQGMSFDEIGYAHGQSKSGATTIHGRALKRLQAILDENERTNRERLKALLSDNRRCLFVNGENM